MFSCGSAVVGGWTLQKSYAMIDDVWSYHYVALWSNYDTCYRFWLYDVLIFDLVVMKWLKCIVKIYDSFFFFFFCSDRYKSWNCMSTHSDTGVWLHICLRLDMIICGHRALVSHCSYWCLRLVLCPNDFLFIIVSMSCNWF